LLALVVPAIAAWLVACWWQKRVVGFQSLDRPLMGFLVAIVVACLVFWFIRILGVSVPWA
jgi:hypothetical protein